MDPLFLKIIFQFEPDGGLALAHELHYEQARFKISKTLSKKINIHHNFPMWALKSRIIFITKSWKKNFCSTSSQIEAQEKTFGSDLIVYWFVFTSLWASVVLIFLASKEKMDLFGWSDYFCTNTPKTGL